MKRFKPFSAVVAVILIVATCILPAAATVAQTTEGGAAYFYGDLNGNGEIDKFDYIVVKRSCMGTITLTDEQLLRGDINQNGEIEKFDYILVKRHVMKTYTIPMVQTACRHELVSVEAVAATCTEEGSIAHYSCKNCGKLFSDGEANNEIALSQTVTDALGHTEVIDNAVEPTCSQSGLTEGKHCSVCNETLVAQREIGKLNHTPSDLTCTEDQYCTVCKEILVSANGHIPSVDATCTEDQYCTVCKILLSPATGHKLTFVPEKEPVDADQPGNCAHWHCSECGKYYLDEKATQEIAPEDIACKLFKITYFCDENNTKQTKWYKVGAEIEDLLVPEIEGYDFKYWKDGYGKRVNGIPANNTENIELYAVVEIKTYTIYFGGTWKYENVTYTINDQVDLPIPVEDGLTFAGWRDSKGKVDAYTDSVGVRRWRILRGTSGDVELMAQWKDNKNLVVPDTRASQDRYISSGYDEDEKCYWFIYSLGEIRNVVLDPESSLVKTKHNGGHIAGSLSLAETLTVEESVGKSVSETVSHTVTNSTDWSMTNDWEQSASAGVDVTVTVGAEVGPEFAKTKVEAAIGVSCEVSSSVGGSITEGGSGGESDENSNTIENNFAYNTAISQTKDRTISFSHDVAPGNYYYANVGTVKVYAFVAFDPESNSFGLETFSVLEKDTSTAVLSDKKDGREYVSDSLSYDVYIDGINNEVNENYFIQYFANNGTGDSVIKMYPANKDVALADNPFTYKGYTFANWAANGKEYSVGETVKDPVGAGQILVLNAQWDANEYTVIYDSNKPGNASGTVGSIPANQKALYDKDITLGSAPSLIGWTFGGWYLDPACTVRVGGANEVKAKANLTSEPNGTATLYAKWTANTYTVIYNANGGSGTLLNTTHTYDSASRLSENGYSRANYTFLGWSKDANAATPTYKAGEAVSTLTTNPTVTLYAVWIQTSTTIVYGNGKNDRYMLRIWNSWGHNDDIYEIDEVKTALNKEHLASCGYTKITVKLKFYYRVDDWGDQLVQIRTNTGSVVKNYTYEWGECGWTYKDDISFTLSLDQVGSDCDFSIKWYLSKDGTNSDTWFVGGTTLEITAE